MRLLKILLATLAIAAMTTGCAVNRATATVDPSTRFETIKSFHVKHLDKDEGDVDKLIAANLRARGYKVSTDKEPAGPADAVVTYVDKWMWDITMYMLELTIHIRDPKTNFPLATGNSYHTSLTRKTPTEMVDEVLGNIMKEGKAN
jgi:hypothetical protein